MPILYFIVIALVLLFLSRVVILRSLRKKSDGRRLDGAGGDPTPWWMLGNPDHNADALQHHHHHGHHHSDAGSSHHHSDGGGGHHGGGFDGGGGHGGHH